MEIKIISFLILSILSGYVIKELLIRRKAKEIEEKSKNAITLDKFIHYLESENIFSRIVSLNVTRHLRKHYNLILIDLDTKKKEKIFTHKKILIINIELINFALERNSPIDPCFEKSA